MENRFLHSPTALFLLRSFLRAQILFLIIFHYPVCRSITLFLGLRCNQLRMLFDLSPSSSSSKMPSSSLSSSLTPITSSYPYSPPSSSPKSPSSSSVIFLSQRPLHRLRRRLSFIIPIFFFFFVLFFTILETYSTFILGYFIIIRVIFQLLFGAILSPPFGLNPMH